MQAKNLLNWHVFLLLVFAVARISFAGNISENTHDDFYSQLVKARILDEPLVVESLDCFNAGLHDESISILENLLSAHDNMTDETKSLIYVGLARNYMEKGISDETDKKNEYYEKADFNFNNALRLINSKDPLNFLISSGLGFIYWQFKNYPQAISYIERGLGCFATGFRGERSDLYVNLGYIYIDLKQYKQAIDCFSRALKLSAIEDDQKLECYLGLARCYKELKSYGQAINYCRKIRPMISRTLKHPEQYVVESYISTLFECKINLTNYQDIYLLKEIEEYWEMNENILLDKYVRRFLDRLYRLFSHKPERSVSKILDKHGLLKNNPMFSHFFWGNYYLYKEDLGKAREEFLAMLKMNPNSAIAYIGLKDICFNEGKALEALKYFMEIKKRTGNKIYFAAYNNLPEIYEQIKNQTNLEDLEKLSVSLLQLLPQYRDVIYCALGQIYLENNLLNKAEEAFQLAVESKISPNVFHADWPYVGLGMVYLERNNYEIAEKYFKDALGIKPHSASSMRALGDFYFKINQFDMAKDLYKKAINQVLENDNEKEMESVMPWMYIRLGDIFLGEGKEKEAKKKYRAVLQYSDAEIKNEALDRLKIIEKRR